MERFKTREVSSREYVKKQLDGLVQFSHSVVSSSLRPHGLQHDRPPCPSPTPRVYSNSCPSELVMSSNHLILCPSPSPPAFNLSQHQGLFFSFLLYNSVSFQMSQFFASGGQNIGVSASTSVLPMNIQD